MFIDSGNEVGPPGTPRPPAVDTHAVDVGQSSWLGAFLQPHAAGGSQRQISSGFGEKGSKGIGRPDGFK